MAEKSPEDGFRVQPAKERAADAETTLNWLKEGNRRFTSHILESSSPSNIERVRYLAKNGQKPLAVLVTCSDARISPERIFSAEMGDFFIIRTAGNVLGALELGSVEYAVASFKTDTVIVMGHENCGAIHSAVHAHGEDIGNMQSILDIIQPSINRAMAETSCHREVIAKAEDYNIINSVEKIKSSRIIRNITGKRKITIVGAKYGISTGKVTFFE